MLDTNIISYLLKGNKSVLQKIDSLAEDDNEISIPSIAYYEIKRGLVANNATTKLTRFLKFVEEIGVVELTTSTLDVAARVYADLKKIGRSIEDDDLFIGSSALEHDAILVTNNVKHFCHIKDLKIEAL
ncbi:MAG: type II toxin-antitoxin system VapC family toxin [Treponema sp.]|nr:type II toxin-antitoxin system VapC family toxin [Treponema sp.]